MPIFEALAGYLGPAMLAGMAAGLTGNAALDSSFNLQNTCDQISSAQENLNQISDAYKKLLSNEMSVKDAISNYRIQAGNHKHNTEILTQFLKDSFRQQQLRQEISLGIFLFVLILFLLLKKFNVIGNIWNLIVKK